MIRDRDNAIFEAVVEAGEPCSVVAKRVDLCSGRVGAIVFEVARRRNPAEYKRMVLSGERSLRAVRANAASYPRTPSNEPKACADADRERFESALTAALLNEGYSAFSAQLMFERGSDGEYRSPRVAGAWWGWNASRVDLVIQRPEKCEFAEAQGPYAKGYRQGIRIMVDAIESAGLRVSR